MEGFDWHALESVVDLIGIEDIELLIAGLEVIRDHQRKTREAQK